MSYSKVFICNMTLTLLGEDSIRSLDEQNKRARSCNNIFDSTRDWLLAKFDWPFARKVKLLDIVVDDENDMPDGWIAYQKPNDCRIGRDVLPFGSKTLWHIMGDKVYVKASYEELRFAYTKQEVSASLFSDAFANLLSIALAVKLAPTLTQDNALTNALNQQFKQEERDAWETDANVGNMYREYDETPDNDAFVSPDLADFSPIPGEPAQ